VQNENKLQLDTLTPASSTTSSSCSCCASPSPADGRTAALVVDPVCGMTVDPANARATSTYQGTTYYFCAPGCRRAFEKDPASFLTPAS